MSIARRDFLKAGAAALAAGLAGCAAIARRREGQGARGW